MGNFNASTPSSVLAEARKYYQFLFSAKEPLLNSSALQAFCRTLHLNPIPKSARESCD